MKLQDVMAVHDIGAELGDAPFKSPKPNAPADLARGQANYPDALGIVLAWSYLALREPSIQYRVTPGGMEVIGSHNCDFMAKCLLFSRQVDLFIAEPGHLVARDMDDSHRIGLNTRLRVRLCGRPGCRHHLANERPEPKPAVGFPVRRIGKSPDDIEPKRAEASHYSSSLILESMQGALGAPTRRRILP
jgi:hypothetical protein